jgi:hypothetical protein
MKMNKKILISGMMLSTILLVIMPVTFANPIPIDEKLVKIRYFITNIEEYSDYVFIVYQTGSIYFDDPYFIIQPGVPFWISMFGDATIFMVSANEFNESEIGETRTEMNEYFYNNTKVIKSNVELIGLYTAVPPGDPLDYLQVNLEISGVTDELLHFNLLKVTFCNTDGSSTEIDGLPSELSGRISIPTEGFANPTSISSMEYWFIIVPCAAAIVIVLTVISNHRKKIRL